MSILTNNISDSMSLAAILKYLISPKQLYQFCHHIIPDGGRKLITLTGFFEENIDSDLRFLSITNEMCDRIVFMKIYSHAILAGDRPEYLTAERLYILFVNSMMLYMSVQLSKFELSKQHGPYPYSQLFKQNPVSELCKYVIDSNGKQRCIAQFHHGKDVIFGDTEVQYRLFILDCIKEDYDYTRVHNLLNTPIQPPSAPVVKRIRE